MAERRDVYNTEDYSYEFYVVAEVIFKLGDMLFTDTKLHFLLGNYLIRIVKKLLVPG